MIKVVTINVLSDLDTEHWNERLNLLVNGLKAVNADIIGAQEINSQTADYLSTKLDMSYVYQLSNNCLAILSRYPFIQQQEINLKTQNRHSQFVQVEANGKQVIFCNGHYFWRPGSSKERMEQFKTLVENLDQLTPKLPIINLGDFNAMPQHSEVKFLRQHFTSAYADYHGKEPGYTCPTPLIKKRSWKTKIAKRLVNVIVNRQLKPWKGTLDYIFVSPSIQVNNCELILTEPSANNPQVYPSDHFGIAAELEI